MANILVVEDEKVIRASLVRLLKRDNHEVSEADSVDRALNNHNLGDIDLIISDLRLPGSHGTELIRLAGSTPVLIMTSYASLKTAVDSMKLGAIDYIAKPYDHDEMLSAVNRALAKSQGNKASNKSTLKHSSTMIGESAAMAPVYQRINKVAPTSVTVLIQGETGTGKELVAKSIHKQSPRAQGPLISVNCAAIPDTLIESELFGYEKGAFTGASSQRDGLVAAADGGTLFLDEVGELPLDAQARLLRVLQEKEVRPIGATKSRKVDIRLVAATHRNLRELAKQGKFREDLYYRLDVISVKLPPLRQRDRDVLLIADSILSKAFASLGRDPIPLSPEAIQAITTYRWPGNVRELENVMQRAAILCDDTDEIPPSVLDIELALVDSHDLNSGVISLANGASVGELEGDLSLEDYFQRFVLEHQDAMSETELAKKLGVSRKCLWERRQRFGIPRKKRANISVD